MEVVPLRAAYEFDDSFTGTAMVAIYLQRHPVTGSIGETVTVEVDGKSYTGAIKSRDNSRVILALS